jgi:flagellar hook-associated protein 2
MATQLATYDIQAFQQRYQIQSDKYQGQLEALGKVESALRDFRTAVNAMNSSSSNIIKNSATVSQDGYFSANANASAMTGSYQIFVEQIATAHQLSTGMPADLDPSTEIPTTGILEFTVDGQTMTLDLSTVNTDADGKATISDLVSAINNDPDNPGVNATLVRSNGQTHFMLSSEETGVANQINVTASGTGATWFEDAFTNTTDISVAKDAVIWLGAEGTGLKLENSSNTFTGVIDGVDLTVSNAQTSGEAPITLKIGPDDEATKEQINNFIDAYNTLATTLSDFTNIGGEDSARGVLANDPTLRSIDSQLTSLIRGEYDGLSLNDVGITINREGKMELDAAKFSDAQNNNSAALEAMFNGDGNLLDSIDTMAEPFLMSNSGLFSNRKDTLQQNISRIDDKQVGLERKYDMSYDRYLKQFTQMNILMTQMNQTMSMFGQS